MSDVTSPWDLSEVEVTRSAKDASLRVVTRLTAQMEDVTAQWATTTRPGQANGASLRDIGGVVGVSPRTVAKICAG